MIKTASLPKDVENLASSCSDQIVGSHGEMDMSLINSDCNQILADEILRHASHNEIALLVFSFFLAFRACFFWLLLPFLFHSVSVTIGLLHWCVRVGSRPASRFCFRSDVSPPLLLLSVEPER